MFKFEVWKKSPESRHIVETIMIAILGALIIYYANNFLDSTKNASTLKDEIDAIEAGTATGDVEPLYDILASDTKSFYNDILGLIVVNSLTVGYLFKNIQELVY